MLFVGLHVSSSRSNNKRMSGFCLSHSWITRWSADAKVWQSEREEKPDTHMKLPHGKRIVKSNSPCTVHVNSHGLRICAVIPWNPSCIKTKKQGGKPTSRHQGWPAGGADFWQIHCQNMWRPVVCIHLRACPFFWPCLPAAIIMKFGAGTLQHQESSTQCKERASEKQSNLHKKFGSMPTSTQNLWPAKVSCAHLRLPVQETEVWKKNGYISEAPAIKNATVRRKIEQLWRQWNLQVMWQCFDVA